jgi:hypothetical protein
MSVAEFVLPEVYTRFGILAVSKKIPVITGGDVVL